MHDVVRNKPNMRISNCGNARFFFIGKVLSNVLQRVLKTVKSLMLMGFNRQIELKIGNIRNKLIKSSLFN
ncbi:hypothetical protein EGI26_15270 [Lacihabitans sp. CCS-44]|nr:hypothetical protein [Lacihabitans sp. CCS-44]